MTSDARRILSAMMGLLLLGLNSASASTLSAVGVRAGIVISELDIRGDAPLYCKVYFRSSPRSHIAPALVVWAEWLEHRWASLATEMVYTSRGRKETVAYACALFDPKLSKSSEEKFDERAKYLSFPVLVKVKTSRLPGIEPYLVAGPRFDVLIDHDDGPYVERFQRFQFGIDAGVGLHVLLFRSIALVIDARYSMTPVFGTRNLYFTDYDERVTAHAWQFTFGCRFPT